MKIKNVALFVCFFGLLFVSCEKTELSLEDLYEALPDIEHVSQNYTVNGISFDGKKYFDPPNQRTGENHPRHIRYQDNDLVTVYNLYANSWLIIFAVDTKNGDVCSVYEGQGVIGQLVFINGKLIEIESSYSLIDLKLYKSGFIFVLANQAHKKYVLYKP